MYWIDGLKKDWKIGNLVIVCDDHDLGFVQIGSRVISSGPQMPKFDFYNLDPKLRRWGDLENWQYS
jgi:hypothetical protein